MASCVAKSLGTGRRKNAPLVFVARSFFSGMIRSISSSATILTYTVRDRKYSPFHCSANSRACSRFSIRTRISPGACTSA
ncbi:unnamed protein product [Periconia digitata]|uniref:Uncharacterized protein n=1 Tax=Periconia digitata TaxID=1303443 RepID=A0A9W4UMR1_9PLEO|nr:unnamed protein product [Periconia digitata]